VSSLRRPNFIRREWQPLLNVAELPKVGFNTLRHTTATDGLPMGLRGEIVQTRLDHAQIATTVDMYSDVLPELEEMAADLLDAERGFRVEGVLQVPINEHTPRSPEAPEGVRACVSGGPISPIAYGMASARREDAILGVTIRAVG
jgi:hypothetical protein